MRDNGAETRSGESTQDTLESSTDAAPPKILVPGRNCWRKETAHRVKFLIDGQAYFDAFKASVSRARQSIFIIGWDINGRIHLQRESSNNAETELGPFLDETLSRRKQLHAYLLAWDFSMIYALDRELVPIFGGSWTRHRRLHYKLDDNHPPLASHHQKIVVIDDAVAFVGGFDLGKDRWDTTAHLEDDPRRRDRRGRPYAPFHDVQTAIDGPAAAALADLARWRWLRGTGEELEPSQAAGNDPWPADVEPDVNDVEVGIARTLPAHGDDEEVCEIKNLYLDAIASARHTIYIENQYLTSSVVGEALAERLSEPNGPEVILVLPLEASGWLEQSTMGVLRARVLSRLRAADTHHRLGIYYPVASGSSGTPVQVHAKVLVVDDQLVRVGSSNLNNRSMGVDTECDVAIESDGNPRVEGAIRDFRNRCLADHLGQSLENVTATVASEGSLAGTLNRLRGADRRLRPLEPVYPEWVTSLAPKPEVIDPERPVAPEELIRHFVEEEVEETQKNPWIRGMVALLVLLGLAAAWRWTPLQEWISLENLRSWADFIRGHTLAPLMVIGAFVVGSTVMIPLTLLIVLTALTFDPIPATIYSMLGGVAAGAATFGLGHVLGKDTIRRLAGSRLNRLSRRLSRRGFVTVVAARNLPVAPFTVVNVVAGASHIRLRDFMLGTAVGLAPGVIAVTLFESRLEDAIRNPGWGSWLLVGVVASLIVIGFVLLRRHLAEQEK